MKQEDGLEVNERCFCSPAASLAAGRWSRLKGSVSLAAIGGDLPSLVSSPDCICVRRRVTPPNSNKTSQTQETAQSSQHHVRQQQQQRFFHHFPSLRGILISKRNKPTRFPSMMSLKFVFFPLQTLQNAGEVCRNAAFSPVPSPHTLRKKGPE